MNRQTPGIIVLSIFIMSACGRTGSGKHGGQDASSDTLGNDAVVLTTNSDATFFPSNSDTAVSPSNGDAAVSTPDTVVLPPASDADGSPSGSDAADIWIPVGAPTEIHTDEEFYSQIDGAAPMYLDRGWVSATLYDYQRGGNTLYVTINDMGDTSNAQKMFEYLRPVSILPIEGLANAFVDSGLSVTYKTMAFVGRYYVEVYMDAHTPTALADIKALTRVIANQLIQQAGSIGD